MTIATSEQRLQKLGTARVRALRPDAASVLALIALACAAVGLVGWLLHLDTIVSFVSYSVVPKFNGVLVKILNVVPITADEYNIDHVVDLIDHWRQIDIDVFTPR